LIEENLLQGGGFTLYVGVRSPLEVTSLRVLRNRFGRVYATGPINVTASSPEITDNVWDDTGEPIP
jgi:hypothetical protein